MIKIILTQAQSTFAVSSHAFDATTDHVTLSGYDKFEQDDRLGNSIDDTTDHLGGGCSNVDDSRGLRDILVSGMERNTIRMPLTTPATMVTPVGRKLQLPTDNHSTPINANCLSIATPGFLDDTIAGIDHPVPHHPNQPDHPPPNGHMVVNQPTTPAHHPLPFKHKKCSYIAGVCDTHGEGATLKWKPKPINLPGGAISSDLYHELVCDIET